MRTESKNGNKPRPGGYRNLWRERKDVRRREAEERQVRYNAGVNARVAQLADRPSELWEYMESLSASQRARIAAL